MRITKSKINEHGKNKPVLIHRENNRDSFLTIGEKVEDKTSEILPSLKKDSFYLSIINQTIIKKKDKKTDALKNFLQKNLENKYPLLPKNILKNELKTLLKPRFQKDFSYTDKKGEKHSFNLLELLINSSSLDPYKDWAKNYINVKSKFIIKSIKNNKIIVDYNNDKLSKRQQVLKDFLALSEADFNEKMNTLHDDFKISDLKEKFTHIIIEENPKKKNFVDKPFEYCQAVKKCLKDHQSIFFSKTATNFQENRDNKEFSLYSNEVTKYIEHYFPLKKTKREITMDYVKYYFNEETIKSTIENQIKNSMRASQIQRNKIELFKLDKNTTSEILAINKRKEAFVRNLTNRCFFASYNIRNIVNKNLAKDILYEEDFISSLKTGNFNDILFKTFFGIALPENKNKKIKTLCALRGSVQKIRNNNIHYKYSTYLKTLEINNFTLLHNTETYISTETPFNRRNFEPRDDTSFSDTIFKDCFANDIENLPKVIKTKLKSVNILDFYSFDEIQKCFASVPLRNDSRPFASSFKRVMKKGQNIQNDTENKNELNLSFFKKKELFTEETEQKYGAYYFLMKFVYTNLFLQSFYKDKYNFKKLVNEIRKTNIEEAKKTTKKNNSAFKDIRKMAYGEEITSYLAYVHSESVQEQQKKGEENDETNHNFEKFLLKIYIKGFDEYLRKNNFDFILKPEKREGIQEEEYDKLNIDVNSDLKEDDSSQISFYVFCKLLDASNLSELQNEFIKLRQTIIEEDPTEKAIIDIKLQIIKLCLHTVDNISLSYKYKDAYIEKIKPFFEDNFNIADFGDLYQQTDEKSIVTHANIDIFYKYGTIDLLTKITKGNKITKKDFEEWKKLKSQIEDLTKSREKLHEEWVENKKDIDELKPNDKEGFKKYKKLYKEYEKLCEKIDRYNWLDNKLHFVHLQRLHNLTIEILSRLAGFTIFWERDIKDNKITEIYPNFKNFDKLKYKQQKNSEITEFKKYFEISNNRNYIAHYNYLTAEKGNPEKSIFDMINDLRNVMDYDRKLKNAVLKSIIKIFDRNGMLLSFKIDHDNNEKIKSAIIEAKTIEHLKTKNRKPVATYSVDKEYLDICCLLLGNKK